MIKSRKECAWEYLRIRVKNAIKTIKMMVFIAILPSK